MNTDKAVTNLVREHTKLKRRLEEVQNPEFLINLKRRLRETELEIQNQQKLTRQLHNDQVRREQRLDKIIEKNEPETMKQINDQTARLAYLNEKLSELQEEKLRSEALKTQQANTLDELKVKMSKLQEIASHYGISLETHDEDQKQYKELMEQHEALLKQKRVLQTAIEASSKRYEAQLVDKKKEYE